MELLDVLDSNGKSLDFVSPRDEVHKHGYWHKAIHVLVINKNKEILLQKRSENKEKNPGLWDISCAGHLSAGDSSIDGAIREMKEELGIQVIKSKLELIYQIKKSYIPKPHFLENEFQDIYLYEADIDIKDIVIQKEELSEVKYVPYEIFKVMIRNEDKTFVNRKKEYEEIFNILDKKYQI